MQGWFMWIAIAMLFSDQMVGMCLQYRSIAAACRGLQAAAAPAWRRVRRTPRQPLEDGSDGDIDATATESAALVHDGASLRCIA
jgi:hypothetical protein